MAWSVGELAVAIEDKWWNKNGSCEGPAKGQILKIAEMKKMGARRCLYFRFNEFPVHGYRHDCFRKIKPDILEGEKEDWNLLLEGFKHKELITGN